MNRKQYSQSVQNQMSKSGHVYSQVSIMVYIYEQSGDYSQVNTGRVNTVSLNTVSHNTL